MANTCRAHVSVDPSPFDTAVARLEAALATLPYVPDYLQDNLDDLYENTDAYVSVEKTSKSFQYVLKPTDSLEALVALAEGFQTDPATKCLTDLLERVKALEERMDGAVLDSVHWHRQFGDRLYALEQSFEALNEQVNGLLVKLEPTTGSKGCADESLTLKDIKAAFQRCHTGYAFDVGTPDHIAPPSTTAGS